MIAGYFMCKSHISLRKFMKLLFEIISITFYGICPSFFQHCFLRIVVPVQSFGVNFVTCFVIFYLLIPLASVVFMTWLSTVFVDKNIYVFWFVADSNHFMTVVTTFCSFMFFKDLNIGY